MPVIKPSLPGLLHHSIRLVLVLLLPGDELPLIIVGLLRHSVQCYQQGGSVILVVPVPGLGLQVIDSPVQIVCIYLHCASASLWGPSRVCQIWSLGWGPLCQIGTLVQPVLRL